MRAGSTAVILRQWHGGRRGGRKKRHRGWQERKAKCSRVEKTKGQVWSRQDQARNRDLTHKTGSGEGAGGLTEQKILVSTSTPISNLDAVSDIMRPSQLEGWHCEIILNRCITLCSKEKLSLGVNENQLCISTLAGLGIVPLFKVFTAHASYSHSGGNLRCAAIHHLPDIRGLMALRSAQSSHDKWMHTYKYGLVFTVSDI